MRDEDIIDLYYARNESAIQATMDSYGRYCSAIAGNILNNPSDVEEVVSDTWVQAWNSIPPERPTYLRLFLGKITRNLSLSLLRYQTADRRGGGQIVLALEELTACINGSYDPEAQLESRRLGQLISIFLKSEPPNNRIIFLRRYYYLEPTKQIALRLGVSDANVRMCLSRTRKRLKEHLEKEDFTV